MEYPSWVNAGFPLRHVTQTQEQSERERLHAYQRLDVRVMQ